MVMETIIVNDANLNFTSVAVKDQGDYFCASPEHKLVKTVSLTVNPRFEKAVHGLKYLVFRDFVDNHARETRSIQGWQYPDTSEILEMQRKESEERLQRAKADVDRSLAEITGKSDDKAHLLPIKITVAVVGCLVLIGLGVYLSWRRIVRRRMLLHAIHEAQDLMEEARTMGDRVRHLEEAAVSQPQTSNRGRVEFHCNGDGGGQVQPSLKNLPESNSKGHDLPPPSYHDAVVGVDPSAPPGDEASVPPANASHLSNSKTRK